MANKRVDVRRGLETAGREELISLAAEERTHIRWDEAERGRLTEAVTTALAEDPSKSVYQHLTVAQEKVLPADRRRYKIAFSASTCGWLLKSVSKRLRTIAELQPNMVKVEQQRDFAQDELKSVREDLAKAVSLQDDWRGALGRAEVPDLIAAIMSRGGQYGLALMEMLASIEQKLTNVEAASWAMHDALKNSKSGRRPAAAATNGVKAAEAPNKLKILVVGANGTSKNAIRSRTKHIGGLITLCWCDADKKSPPACDYAYVGSNVKERHKIINALKDKMPSQRIFTWPGGTSSIVNALNELTGVAE
jgi:hypothetical protein